jgi:peptide/nickel transport system substrate-binding protein
MLSAIALILAVACAPTGSPPNGSVDQQTATVQPDRVLVLIGRSEPSTLAGTLLLALGTGANTQRRPFNAGLSMGDADDQPIPYLAEVLPQLNTDTWRVFPDGTMETTFRLRPDLRWHDGEPLSGADFVFAWRVYTNPELGTAASPPHTLMEEVLAPDGRTIVVRWKRPYPGAGDLRALGGAGASPSYGPLPHHILGPTFGADARAFATQAYWTTEYVGLGPYKLQRWEPGAFIEGAAFEGHALGRPKIDRIRFLFISDANAALASLLSGEAHVPVDDSIGLDQALRLKEQWGPRAGGSVLFVPGIARYVRIQHRPEYASPRALLDVRVRRAVALSIDKQDINDGIFYGAALMSDTMIPPVVSYYAQVERAVRAHPFDPRRAESLLIEAGYPRAPDGVFLEAGSDARLNLEIKNISSDRNNAERSIMANGFRQVGFEIDEAAYTPVQARDNEALATFRSLSPTGGVQSEDRFLYFASREIPSPQTRWIGSNRGGWSNPDYDRLMDALNTTLARDERIRLVIEAARILNEDVAIIPLYYAPTVVAYPSELSGILVRGVASDIEWNIHEWQLSR